MRHQVKQPNWRQPTPHHQFLATIAAMEGAISNFEEKIIDITALATELRKRTDELKALAYFLDNPKEW